MPLTVSRGLRTKLSAGQALTPESERLLSNPDWTKAAARILIVRLSPFRDVDRSTSHLVLFAELRRRRPALYIDFAFFPSRGERLILRTASAQKASPEASVCSWYYGIASGRAPADFDLILVSNSFGLELINLPYLFSTSAMPMRAGARRRMGGFPLVIAGGSNASAAGPLVFENGDSFVDGFFFGEAEDGFVPLADILIDSTITPAERLKKATLVPGFWAPESAIGEIEPWSVQRRLCAGSPPPLVDQPLLNSEESSTARIQISAGCPGLCSFCFEGWDRKPYRELPLEQVVECARAVKRRTGADTLEVFSFNFNTHASVFALFFELGRIFRRVSFMSQRLDILAETPLLLEAELAAEKRSFTLGVEGVSARMRAFYRKGLSSADIDRLLDRLVNPEVREIKLFYIISGLETGTDIEEFGAFMADLARRKSEKAPGLRVLASAGYLVRIPRTPLQYAPLALDKTLLEDISTGLRAAAAKSGIEFRVASRFDEYCADQILTLRGEPLAPWLEKIPTHNFVYDGALDHGVWESMEAFLKTHNLLDSGFTGEKTETYHPPLPVLAQDPGLYNEYLEAKAGKDKRMSLQKHILPGRPEDIRRIHQLRSAKASFAALRIEACIPDELTGATDSYRAAWITRKLLEAMPGSESQIFESREILFASGGICGLPEGWTGRSIFEVYGPRPEFAAEAARRAGFEPWTELQDISALQSVDIDILLAPELGLSGFREYLSGLSLSWTELKDAADGSRLYKFSPRDSRKGLILEAHSAAMADGPSADAGWPILVRLRAGTHLNISPWIRAEQNRILDCPAPIVRVRRLNWS